MALLFMIPIFIGSRELFFLILFKTGLPKKCFTGIRPTYTYINTTYFSWSFEENRREMRQSNRRGITHIIVHTKRNWKYIEITCRSPHNNGYGNSTRVGRFFGVTNQLLSAQQESNGPKKTASSRTKKPKAVRGQRSVCRFGICHSKG